jgi:hypothetical protein
MQCEPSFVCAPARGRACVRACVCVWLSYSFKKQFDTYCLNVTLCLYWFSISKSVSYCCMIFGRLWSYILNFMIQFSAHKIFKCRCNWYRKSLINQQLEDMFLISFRPSWYNSLHPNSKRWFYWAIKSQFGIYYFLKFTVLTVIRSAEISFYSLICINYTKNAANFVVVFFS